MAEFIEKVVVGPPVALDLQGTNIPSRVVPFTKDDKYATHDEEFGRGGYRSVATVAEMNAISGDRRKEGMLVNVIGDKIYKLVNGSFVDAGLGGGGNGSNNVKVLTTPDLVTPSRTNTLTLSNSDVAILKGLTGVEVIVFNGKYGQLPITVPLTVVKTGTSSTTFTAIVNYVVGNKIYLLTLRITNDTGTATAPLAQAGTGGGSEIHDLTIDVKTGNKNGVSTIYYRIREVVPNGYIQFVRKKKKVEKGVTPELHQNSYAVDGLSFMSRDSGVDASTLLPNVWYEFPIKANHIVSSYAAGSLDLLGRPRRYSMYKFSGNTHARPIKYDTGNVMNRTTVLHAGLQYNVLADTYMNGTAAKVIFKQRGEVVPVKARLTVISTTDFAKGYKLRFAIE